MCNAGYPDKLRAVVNYVQDAPVAYSNTPNVAVRFQFFLQPGGLGFSPRNSILRTALDSTLFGEFSSSFLAEGFTSTT